ncbi:MAG: PadR family transcriptional regulator [Spirochaetales bacterium]|nr:PadR family transcriptional regulator [Spirochaetales bacterium]
MNTEDFEGLYKKNIQEMRRGNLLMAVLALLPVQKYGYALLKEMNSSGFPLTQDTLYPLLRRLEDQGLLSSEWIIDTSRPRKYYLINENGVKMLESLKEEWQNQSERLREVIK